MHQAGSDSLLTAAVFFKMKEVWFGGQLDDAKYVGVLYGLGVANEQKQGDSSDRHRYPN